MKLNIVPAKTGVLWFRQGVRTFFKQPLALMGLFFLFMLAMSVFSMVPLLGNVLALTILPGATLGLMAATREASLSKFPMPKVLLSGFSAGRQQLRAMLVLGLLYAVGFLLVLGLSALMDGGKFAHLYLFGGSLSAESVQSTDFQEAFVLAMVLYMPLSLLFWHAPALVHWHGISPVKSLFFSLVACLRNFWAFTVYSLVWLGAFLAMGMVVAIIAGLTDSAEQVAGFIFPAAIVMAAMFFTSIYFTFNDCFLNENGEAV
jgi:hypothetical protein